MKKIFNIAITALVSLCCFMSPMVTHAATAPVTPTPSPVAPSSFDPFAKVCDGTTADSSVCTDKDSGANPISGTGSIFVTAAKILARITGIASVIMVLFGSIKYVTAGGDNNSITSAKQTIVYALMGIVVAALAQGMIILVVNKLN